MSFLCRYILEKGAKPDSCDECQHYYGMCEHCMDYDNVVFVSVKLLKDIGASPCLGCEFSREKCSEEQKEHCDSIFTNDVKVYVGKDLLSEYLK